jgi:hypothetical protein
MPRVSRDVREEPRRLSVCLSLYAWVCARSGSHRHGDRARGQAQGTGTGDRHKAPGRSALSRPSVRVRACARVWAGGRGYVCVGRREREALVRSRKIDGALHFTSWLKLHAHSRPPQESPPLRLDIFAPPRRFSSRAYSRGELTSAGVATHPSPKLGFFGEKGAPVAANRPYISAVILSTRPIGKGSTGT